MSDIRLYDASSLGGCLSTNVKDVWRVVLVSMFTALISTRSYSAELTDARYTKLNYGINLSHWYAQSDNGYDEERLSSYTTRSDMKLMRGKGFTHVRIPLSPSLVFTDGPGIGLNKTRVALFKSRVQSFVEEGLAVVVDLHPSESEKRELGNQVGDTRLVDRWNILSKELSTLNPEFVFLEVLNEPHPLVGSAWHELQGRLLTSIRSGAPDHTIVLNPGGWSGVDDFENFKPYTDRNVVYTMHWYGPILFTHQGASWSWNIAEQVAGLGWPVTQEAAEAAALKARSDEARNFVRQHAQDGQFQKNWIEQQFNKLSRWQTQNDGARVYVGEFGAYRKVSPALDRFRWHRASREAFEARGWGWSVWDFKGGFGVANELNGKTTFEPKMMEALGRP